MPRNTRWLFYLSLAVLTFVVGAWLVRTPEPARPLPWLADWQEQVLGLVPSGCWPVSASRACACNWPRARPGSIRNWA